MGESPYLGLGLNVPQEHFLKGIHDQDSLAVARDVNDKDLLIAGKGGGANLLSIGEIDERQLGLAPIICQANCQPLAVGNEANDTGTESALGRKAMHELAGVG